MRRKNLFRKIAAIVVSAAMAVSVAACGGSSGSSTSSSTSSGDNTLDIITWSSIFTDEECQAIKKATGITVNVTPFNSLEELYTKMNSGGVKYDMCVTGDYMAGTLIKDGMLKKLDKDKLKEAFDDVDDSFKNPYYDKNLDYCYPLGGGTVGIMVNRDKVKNDIKSWKDLFDTSLKGKIVMLDDQRIILGIGNVLNGNDFNATDPDQINAAEQTMEKIIPNVKLFESFDQYDAMSNGEADIMVGWSHEAYKLTTLNKGNYEYIYPEEGMHIYVDNYCLTSNTKKDDLCYKLINYMHTTDYTKVLWSDLPEARLAYKSFKDSLDLDDLGEKIIFPPQEQYDKGLYLHVLDNTAMKAYDDAWTTFKQKASIE